MPGQIIRPSTSIGGTASSALKRVIPSNFKLSDLFKNFNPPNVGDFVFDNVTIQLSGNTVSFSGDLKMDGPLAVFKNYINTNDSITVTASFSTTSKDISKKIDPVSATFKATIVYFKQVFRGVSLTQAIFQVQILPNGSSWAISPAFTGEFDVDNLTDKDSGKMNFTLIYAGGSLQLTAAALNLTGVFGVDNLTLDTITVTGALGSEDSLSIKAKLIAGGDTFSFDGDVSKDSIGILASADKFTLDQLTNIFNQSFATSLKLPEFDVTFKNTSISLASADMKIGTTDVQEGFTIITEVTAQGHTIDATAQISSGGVSFDGTLDNVDFGPVHIKKTTLDFQIYKKSLQKPTKFELSGEAVIKGLTLNCGVYFEKNISTWVTVLYANIEASTFGMANIIPAFKNTFVNDLQFSKVGFIYASADTTTQNEGTSFAVKEGLQLIGVLEEIPVLSELTKSKQIGLVLSAHFGTTTDISIAIPDTRIDLGHSVTTDPLKIQIDITPDPAIVLIFGMDVTIPKQATPLHFDLALSLSLLEANGSVTMKGYWNDPFGIDGVKIGPAVALQIGIIYEQFVSTGIPSEFGIAGGLDIGDTVIDMAVNISENPSEEILSGKLAKLDPTQLLDFAAKIMGFTIPNIPDFFEIKDLEIYIAPTGGTIGTITYKPGFSFAGDLVLFGKEISLYTRISDSGIEGAGHIDKISFGPLKITGEKGQDAVVDLELTADKQSLLIDGAFTFLGLEEGLYVDISNQGLAFKFEQNFFDKLTFEVNGKSKGSLDKPSTLDFDLSGKMDNDINSYLKNQVVAKINDVLNATSADIAAAQAKVNKAEKAYQKVYGPAEAALTKAQAAADKLLDKLTGALNAAKAKYAKDLGVAQKAVDKAKGVYDSALTKAQNAVKAAERKYDNGISSAQSALNKAQKKYNDGINSAQSAVNKAEKKYNNSIGSAERAVDSASRKVDELKKDHYHWGTTLIAYGVAKGVLAAAKAFLEGIKYGADYTAFETAKGALKAAKTGVNFAAFNTAKAALQAAKTGVNFAAFNTAKAALEAVKKGGDYTVWQTALKSLSAVKKAGEAAVAIADAAVNNIGKSAAYVALAAAKEALIVVEKGTEAVAFDTAKAALAAAKLGSAAVLKLSAYIAKHAGDLVDIKKFTFSASLKAIESGNLFDATLDIVLLGHNYNLAIDFDVKNVADFIDSVFHKVLKELESIVS
jgi:hypothetical protein